MQESKDDGTNILKDALHGAADRFGSVNGVFSIIAILYNWRVFVVLFMGSESAGNRIRFVTDIYRGGPWMWFREVFLVPGILTLFYLITIPVLRTLYAWWVQKWIFEKDLNALEHEKKLSAYKAFDESMAVIAGMLKSQIEETNNQLREISAEANKRSGQVELIASMSRVKKLADGNMEKNQMMLEQFSQLRTGDDTTMIASAVRRANNQFDKIRRKKA